MILHRSECFTDGYINNMYQCSCPFVSNDYLAPNQTKEQEYHASHRSWKRNITQPNQAINTKTCK